MAIFGRTACTNATDTLPVLGCSMKQESASSLTANLNCALFLCLPRQVILTN